MEMVYPAKFWGAFCLYVWEISTPSTMDIVIEITLEISLKLLRIFLGFVYQK